MPKNSVRNSFVKPTWSKRLPIQTLPFIYGKEQKVFQHKRREQKIKQKPRSIEQ